MRNRVLLKWYFCVALIFYFFPAFGSSLQFFYNLPPNDNPHQLGLRSNFIQQMQAAQQSIECAFYQINDPKIVDSWIRASRRGVKIILTTDTDWYDYPAQEYERAKTKLKEASILVIDDQGESFNHNKYCMIDRETKRARVWIGSANGTTQDVLENANASFLLVDENAAHIFYEDFRQMANKIFQRKKGGVFSIQGELKIIQDKEGTPAGLDAKDFEGCSSVAYPELGIKKTKIHVYFSPRHNIQKQIVEALYSAKESIHFAMYTLDNLVIYQTLMNKAKNRDEYNLFPVALRREPWEKSKKVLRISKEDGVSFLEKEISLEDWEILNKEQGGLEEEGKIHSLASYVYPAGIQGGKIKKIPVYGILNQLGVSKGPYETMLEKKMPIRIAASRGALHHKFLIIDKKILIIGSYNFSNNAEMNNDESVIMIEDSDLVRRFYEDVFVPTYKSAFPEYIPSQEELDEFSYERRSIVITEILFDSLKGVEGRYVEIYNNAKEEVDLTGWKLWNGNVPWHEEIRLRGTTDDLISYYNDPWTNSYRLNHKTEGYFLKPQLQVLYPGEYGLIVGRNFKLEYLDAFLSEYEKGFERRHGRKPKYFYEKYPKLFVCSDPLDSVVGDKLKPYHFITLFYPDKFTVADRFDHNQILERLKLKKGQSLERVIIDQAHIKQEYHPYQQSYFNGNYIFYWYGLSYYNEANHWEPNPKKSATPGF